MSVRLMSCLIGVLVVIGYSHLTLAAEELTWQDCLREAAKNHPDLIASQEGVTQEEAAKTIAASNELPQITADLNASSAQSKHSGASNSFNYGASGTQLLFDGLKTVNNIKAASENVKAARENFRFTSTDVRHRLRAAFINLLKAHELVNLTQEIYNIRKSNLDLITLRYQSGTEHKGALLTAQANLSQASFEINQARRGVETAERQLIKELGRTQFSPVTVKGSFDMNDDVLQKPDFEILAKDHPSLLKIAAQKNAASFDVKANEGDFWPDVSLTGGVSKADSRWPPQETVTSAGVKVSWPLFEGGLRLAKVAQAKSVYRQLTEEERSARDGIVLSLQQNWSVLQDSVESVKVQKDFLNAVEERAKIAEQQYAVGLISFDNWTIIEDDLVKNKKLFLDVQTNALLAEANWIQARGETIEYEKE